MIEHGATSIWERWDGIASDGWPAHPTMNSFNHCALGSMGAWLVEGVCGLRPSDDTPAFAAFGFAPRSPPGSTTPATACTHRAGRCVSAGTGTGPTRWSAR